MHKKIKYYILLIIALFFVSTNNVFARSYIMDLIPYNVSTACDLEVDGGQACFEEYLKGNLNSYEITNGIVEGEETIMVITRITPSSDSNLYGIQYVVQHDVTKVDYYSSSYGEEYGTLVSEITDENLGYTYNFFPSVTVGRSTYKTWKRNGPAAFWPGNVSLIYSAGSNQNLAPLVKTTPLSAYFYTIKKSVAPGSKIVFQFSLDPSDTAFSDKTGGAEHPYATFNTLELNVLSNVSADGTLKTLTAKGSNNLSYTFGFVPSDKTKLEYNFMVPNSVESVTFEGTPTDSNVKTINGLSTAHSLSVGDNEVTIAVTAESGDVTNYKITVRRLSNDATIKSVTTDNGVSFGTISNGAYTYSTTVPYTTSTTTFDATKNDSNATITETLPAVWNITTDNTTDKLNTYKINVNAENCKYTSTQVPGNTCTTQEYTFNITRTAPSKNVKLSALKVDGTLIPGFSPTTYEYILNDVGSKKANINITGTVQDNKNSITSGTGIKTVNVGDNTYIVTVTSEDGITTQDYKIYLHKKSGDNYLNSLTVTSSDGTLSPAFVNTFTGDYTYTYGPDVTSINISALVVDTNKASIEIIDATDPSNKKTLVSKKLNSASTNVGIEVTSIEVKVIPEDEEIVSKTYTLNLSRKKSDNNLLSSLSISPGTINETFQKTKGTYTATVEADVTSVTVTAVLDDPDHASIVSITGDSGFKIGSGNIITVTVKSEDEKTKDYTINVTRKQYSIGTLSDIKIGIDSSTPISITGFDPETLEYTLYTEEDPLEMDASTITIEATKTNNEATMTGNVGTFAIARGDNKYKIKVVSQDGTVTNEYIINVYKQKNTDNDTKGVTVAGESATVDSTDPKKYYVTLPNSKSSLDPSEVVISASSDATVVKTTGKINELSTTEDNTFNYSITSEDGETINYTIYITREKSVDANIKVVHLRLEGETTPSRSCTYTGTNTSCTITVPVGTTRYYLIPDIHEKATYTPASTTKYTMDANDANDSIQTKTITVTAENTSVSKTYTVVIERAKSSNANLSSIKLTNVTNGANENITVPSFSPNKISYNLTVPGTVEQIKVEATKEDSKATIETVIPQTITLSNYGLNQFTINVKAEDEIATKAYVLNITREAKTDSKLIDLKVEGSTITDFTPDTLTYTYSDVVYNKTSLEVSGLVRDNASEDANVNAIISSIKVNGNTLSITQGKEVTKDIPLSTGTNKIEITVAAQDRTKTTKYEINVDRELNSDKGIQKVEIYYGGSYHEATYNAVSDTYNITVPYSTSIAQNTTKDVDGYVKVTPNSGAADYDAIASVSMPLTNLVTDDSIKGNVNDHSFVVTAEDNSTKPYNMKIIRTKNNLSELSRVNLYKGDELTTTTYCIFDEGSKKCTISVPVTTTDFRLEGIIPNTSKNATVVFSDGSSVGNTYTLSSVDSTKTINARVTAENEVDYTDYEIKIERAKSSNNYLNDLKTNANSDSLITIPDFASNKTSYEIEVPGTQDSINIKVVAEDPKAKVTITGMTDDPGNTLEFNKELGTPGTTTTISFKVEAENGDDLPYTIKVKRLENNEPRLSSITINGESINEYLTGATFDKDTYEYTLDIMPYQTDKITVGATSIDTEYGTTSNTGVHKIQTIYYDTDYTTTTEYENKIVIRSFAQNKSVYRDYKIIVKRKANSDTGIKKVEIKYDGSNHEATYDSNENKYVITVPNSVIVADTSNVIVTVNDGKVSTDAKATYTMGTTNLLTNDEENENVNTHKFVVTAEDGTIKTYTLEITREKSDNAFLTEILVKDKDGNVIGSFNPSFRENTYTYTVNVPVSTSEFYIEVEQKEPNSVVTGDGRYAMTSSNMVVNVVVTPENNDTTKVKTYKLNIKREASNNNDLDTLEVVNELDYSYTVVQDETSSNKYKVTIPGSVDKIYVKATASSELATVKYINPTNSLNEYSIPVGTKEIEFQIKSESGASQSYYVAVTRSPKEEARLKSLTYTLSDGTVGVFDDFIPDKVSYTIPELPYGTTGIYITAIPMDDDATVSGKIGSQSIVTGNNKFIIKVIAQDGKAETEYEINVSRAKNNDATLRLLSINGETLNETFSSNTFNYTSTVSEEKYSIKPTDITAVPKDPKAKVTLDSELSLSTDTTNYYKIKVVAEDGETTNTYTIAITRPKSSNNKLKEVNLVGASLSPEFNPNTKEYTIIVPYGETDFSIEGVALKDTSTVYGNGDYSLDDNIINLSVAAEDPNVELNIYKFNIVEAQSTDATLVKLSVSGYPFKGTNQTFQSATTNYTIGDIETSVKKLKVNATPANINSSIKYYNDGDLVSSCNNLKSCEINIKEGIGSKTLTVEVTAPDDINTKTYYITYNKVNSTNAYLENIISSEGTFDKAFSKTTKNYNLVIPYEKTSTTLTFTTENSDASIKINNGTSKTSPASYTVNDIVPGETKVVTILVTAQDGTTKETYTISIDRAQATGSNDAYLDSLSVTSYPFDETFEPMKQDYSIGEIPVSVNKLTINATANMSTSTIQYYVNGTPQSSNVVDIPNTDATITVKVTSEDGTSVKNYTIKYTKNANDNAYLKDIIVSVGTLTPEFNKNTGTYTVNVDKDVTSIDLTAKLEDPNATIKINDNDYVASSVKSISNLQPGNNEVVIVVTAEDGITKMTYKVNIKRANTKELITSEIHGHTIDDDYILTFAPQKTVLDLKNELDNDNSKLEVYDDTDTNKLSDSDYVGSGMIVKLVIDGTLNDSKIVIIKGDVTGDGEIDVFDSSDILNHYVERFILKGWKLVAADVTGDGEIDVFDSSDVLNHYVERFFIQYK